MKHFWLLLTVFCFSNASAAGECNNFSFSHIEFRECWKKLASSSLEEVVAVQKIMSDRIKKLDEEEVTKNNILNHFSEAVREFNNYRMAQCEFEASTAAGGNGAGDLRLQCQVRLNREYSARMKESIGIL